MTELQVGQAAADVVMASVQVSTTAAGRLVVDLETQRRWALTAAFWPGFLPSSRTRWPGRCGCLRRPERYPTASGPRLSRVSPARRPRRCRSRLTPGKGGDDVRQQRQR